MILQKKIQLFVLVILTISSFILFSCEDSGTDPKNQSEGTLVVNITDAPFPIDQVAEANVTINKIEVREENEDADFPFITLSTDTQTVNLIDLRNGITEKLVETNIPEGKYDLVRLYVAEAVIILTDGQEFDLTIPSGAQTGIKMFIDPSVLVEESMTAELLLDFDLSKSFVVQGNPNTPAGINGFIFKPVIRAVNNTLAGSIYGEVKDTTDAALVNAQVWVEQDSVITTSFTGENGLYEMIGINTGLYDVLATKEGYDTVRVDGIEIEAGDLLEQNFILTPEN